MVYLSSTRYSSVQVAGDLLYYVWQGKGNNCNTCVFTGALRGEKPHVIIDPGSIANEFGETCFEYLTKAMAEDGIKIDEVGLIINTHGHPDHCQANELIANRSGAWITLSEEEDEFRNTLGEKMYAMARAAAPQFVPFFYLREGDLNLGARKKVELEVLLTPGHSPGSVCIYRPRDKILITGDAVFYGSIGRTDLLGGSLPALKKSIDKLSQLDVECLLPGHSTEYGNIVKGKANVERNFQAVKLFL